MTPPTAPNLDIRGFCRRWRDGNGHLLTVEEITPSDDSPGMYELHGTVSDCRCGYEDHNGPGTATAACLNNLAEGDIFGWSAEPTTTHDAATFVRLLLDLTNDEWSHVALVLDDPDEDAGDWLDTSVTGAFWALRRVSDHQPLHTLRAMVFAGHRDPDLIAAVLLAGFAPDEAAAIAVDLDDAERARLNHQLGLLIALRSEPS